MSRPTSFPRLPFILPPVVGVLGGSFNPAHAGHIHISQEACKRLGIKHVWWMVSPQNPLKSNQDMADYSTRLAHAALLTNQFPSIIITDIEQQLGTQYTVRTLAKLKKRFPKTQFVWIMGADNLSTIHRWEQWTKIFATTAILVLDRAPVSHRALRSKAAIRYSKQRVVLGNLNALINNSLPRWGFAHIRKHPANSTELRKTLGKNAFLSHN